MRNRRVLGALMSVLSLTGCDITEPSGLPAAHDRADIAQQIADRYTALSEDAGLGTVVFEGSPFTVVEEYFNPSTLYEQFDVPLPFVPGYQRVLTDLGLDGDAIADFLSPERRADELGREALSATSLEVLKLPDDFRSWASAFLNNDSWESLEEGVGYRFFGLQIGAPVEVPGEAFVLVPYTFLCGAGCGSGHIAVFYRTPLGRWQLISAPTAWSGYLG